MTLWPWPLVFWPWTCHAWRVTWPTLAPSMKTPRLSVLELCVGHHWKSVRGYRACAESRDRWVGGQKNYILGMLDPDLPIHYATSMALRWIQLKLTAKIMHGPVFKNIWVSAHARNHVICLKYPKCAIAVVLADVDLPYWTSKCEHIAAFTAIFSNICTAHAQKRLFTNFRCNFWHRRLIRRPRFPVRV